VQDILKIALGVVTSIAGFLDAGSIATAAQAGASFRFGLLWAILLGTILVMFLIEMCGRLASVSHHTLADAIRERMGFRYFVVPLCAELVVDWLVVAAEIGGVATALEILTGVPFQVWAIPVAFAMWLVLWLGGLAGTGARTSGQPRMPGSRWSTRSRSWRQRCWSSSGWIR
jgi:NRAMP (natural resistance-associated macrophage protein)-like metal ion transporter